MLVRELLGHLDGRQRMIVYLRFFGQLSQSEIAERVGISQVHVSRLLRSSMTTLRGLLDDSDDLEPIRTNREVTWPTPSRQTTSGSNRRCR